MEVFKKDITFLSMVLGEDNQTLQEQQVTKTATFSELNRRDKTQHKLHFMLVSIFKSNGEDEMKIDSDQLYDITVKAVKILLIVDSPNAGDITLANAIFTEQDKVEFLSDGGALIAFGMWLLKEKISPFFQHLMMK